jgi:hypothetical protein
MSGHAKEHSGDHAPTGGGEASPAEKLPLIGRAITMLRTIVSKEGIKNFLTKVAEWPIEVAVGSYQFFGDLFGAKGGGGGGHHAAAHAH